MYPQSPPPHLPPDPVVPVPPPPVHRIAVPGAGALAALLAALAMLGPFSIDAYLPAFPDIEAGLAATPIEVQQTLTAYMLAFAGMVLWHGALADAFGRRNIILVALVVFAVGTFGCASAHSVHSLWVFRIMQGMSAGAGTVVGRAIIRDLYSDAPAARLLSMVTMIFSIAPAIAPVLGGWIAKFFRLRMIFLFLLVYTVCFRRAALFVRTSCASSARPPIPDTANNYGAIFRSPLFHEGRHRLFTRSPVHHGRGDAAGALGRADQFAWLFIPTVSGIFLGALTANRIAGRTSFARQIGIGFCFLIAAGVANVGYHLAFPPALPWSVLPMFFYTFGMSLVAPGATLLTLDLFPHIRGTVASCQSFALTLLGALVAGVIAPFLSHSVLWLALGQLGFALGALALWLTSRQYRRMLAAQTVG
jgi:DHA1 family bicyclomycin/chloramphenicol resistance-like MFS transporter